MLVCEACGLRLFEHALHCPHCGHAVPGVDDESDDQPASADTPPVRFSGRGSGADVAPADVAPEDVAPAEAAADEPDDGPDWDPDETSRFLPAYGLRRSTRNAVALAGLAVALVAAVASLAWLVGQTMGIRAPIATAAPTRSTPAAPSSTPPRNATVCTHEVARSTNTTCAVATRVLAAVRTLGTDLPDTFRVTIVDPQTRKNATYICAIKSWIECTGDRDARIFVRRQV